MGGIPFLVVRRSVFRFYASDLWKIFVDTAEDLWYCIGCTIVVRYAQSLA